MVYNEINEELLNEEFDESLEWLSTYDEWSDNDEDLEAEESQDGAANDGPTLDEETVTIPKSELEEIKRSRNESYQEGQKLNWVTKIQSDKTEFIKLYESDKKMAQKVLDHFWVDSDPRTLYQTLRKEKFGENDSVFQKDEIMKEIEEKETKKEFGKIIKSLGIDLKTNKGKEFLDEYNFISNNGNKANTDNVETLINKAIKLSWVETVIQKKAKVDKELPVWHSNRNITKNTTTDNFFDKFESKKPADWYK